MRLVKREQWHHAVVRQEDYYLIPDDVDWTDEMAVIEHDAFSTELDIEDLRDTVDVQMTEYGTDPKDTEYEVATKRIDREQQ